MGELYSYKAGVTKKENSYVEKHFHIQPRWSGTPGISLGPSAHSQLILITEGKGEQDQGSWVGGLAQKLAAGIRGVQTAHPRELSGAGDWKR